MKRLAIWTSKTSRLQFMKVDKSYWTLFIPFLVIHYYKLPF